MGGLAGTRCFAFARATLLVIIMSGCAPVPATLSATQQPPNSPTSTGTAAVGVFGGTAVASAPTPAGSRPSPSPPPTIRLGPGEYLAYIDVRQASIDLPPTLVLYAVSARGGMPTPMVEGYEVSAVMPDGASVAFQRGYSATYLLDLVTGEVREIPGTYGCPSPTWSPDYERLACSNGDIQVVEPVSGTVRQITWCHRDNADPTSCESPLWSPDGRWIAFIRSNGRSGPRPASDGVYLVDASCVAHPETCEGMTIGPIGPPHWDLAWSPDGSHLAAATGEDLRTYDLATATWEIAIADFGATSNLAWSRESGQIAYAKHGDVYSIDAGGGEARRLVDAINGAVVGWFVVR